MSIVSLVHLAWLSAISTIGAVILLWITVLLRRLHWIGKAPICIRALFTVLSRTSSLAAAIGVALTILALDGDDVAVWRDLNGAQPFEILGL